MNPLYPAAITVMALLVYFSTTVVVAVLRNRFGVMPPVTTGPEPFLRGLRVQQNTLEYLVLFLPALWLYAWYVSPGWAAAIGLVWVAGRIAYIVGYLRSTRGRMPGFLIAIAALVILLLGACYGVVRAFIA